MGRLKKEIKTSVYSVSLLLSVKVALCAKYGNLSNALNVLFHADKINNTNSKINLQD